MYILRPYLARRLTIIHFTFYELRNILIDIKIIRDLFEVKLFYECSPSFFINFANTQKFANYFHICYKGYGNCIKSYNENTKLSFKVIFLKVCFQLVVIPSSARITFLYSHVQHLKPFLERYHKSSLQTLA